MDDVPALLRRLLTDPGRPRVTWYGPVGERVELSGKVLDNWVAKTANLLVDELDVGPGSRVVLDLPPHWRTVVWLLAIWSVGACAVVEQQPGLQPGPQPDQQPEQQASGQPDAVGHGADPVEVLVTADPGGPSALSWKGQTERVVAVAQPALATRFGPDLPDGVLDYALEVRSFGDVFVPYVRPAPGDRAYLHTDGPPAAFVLDCPYAELLRFASHEAALEAGARLLTGGPEVDPLLDLLGPLVAGGSVVLHHDPAALDAAALERLVRQEAITVTRFRSR